MSAALEPLRYEALEMLAQIIGDFYTGSEITRLFHRSGYPEIVHDGGTKWRFVANDVFAFYGLRVGDDGNLIHTNERASTVRQTKNTDETAFEARVFHPEVVKHGRSHFYRGAYFHAVFECCKALDAAVRNNTGSGKSGQPLMSETLSLSGPIKLNSQQSQSEKDEQQGVMYLCMGLMNAVRNPQAHEPELNWPMSREDALDVLALVSFLFRKLERAVIIQAGTVAARKVIL